MLPWRFQARLWGLTVEIAQDSLWSCACRQVAKRIAAAPLRMAEIEPPNIKEQT
jgi:hypothetical protein